MNRLKIPQELKDSLTSYQYGIVEQGAKLAKRIANECTSYRSLSEEKIFINFRSRISLIGKINGKELKRQIWFMEENIKFIESEFDRGVGCETVKDIIRYNVLYTSYGFLI